MASIYQIVNHLCQQIWPLPLRVPIGNESTSGRSLRSQVPRCRKKPKKGRPSNGALIISLPFSCFKFYFVCWLACRRPLLLFLQSMFLVSPWFIMIHRRILSQAGQVAHPLPLPRRSCKLSAKMSEEPSTNDMWTWILWLNLDSCLDIAVMDVCLKSGTMGTHICLNLEQCSIR